jgi:hypothetical protein
MPKIQRLLNNFSLPNPYKMQPPLQFRKSMVISKATMRSFK